MEKLANSATAALHERDELQKRFKINADKQKQAKAAASARAKKPRHKIPAEGLQFAGYAHLQAYFSGRYLEDLANANEKIKRVQEKAKKAEEKIAELVAKLNKHSERHAAGKLPAKWHMPSRIEGDIGKERTKLDELRTELRKLELQASRIQDEVGEGEGEGVGNVSVSLGEASGEEDV